MSISLTPREQQVLGQLRLGLPLKVIALDLGIHPSTVSTHLSAAAKKLGAQGRVALVRNDGEPALRSLSRCEREVALLARQGLSNTEIAQHRGTSPRTVANQLARVYRKLGVGSRVALALMN